MKPWLKYTIGAALASLVILFTAAWVTRPSDDVLIRQALDEAVAECKDGKSGALLDVISSRMVVNGEPIGTKSEIARMVKLVRPDIKFGAAKAQFQGENAYLITDVNIAANGGGMDQSWNMQGVKIEFAKEAGTRWFLVPTTKWRIINVSAPDAPADLGV